MRPTTPALFRLDKGENIPIGIRHVKFTAVRHLPQRLRYRDGTVLCLVVRRVNILHRERDVQVFVFPPELPLVRPRVGEFQVDRVTVPNDSGVEMLVPEVEAESELPGIEADRPVQIGHEKLSSCQSVLQRVSGPLFSFTDEATRMHEGWLEYTFARKHGIGYNKAFDAARVKPEITLKYAYWPHVRRH